MARLHRLDAAPVRERLAAAGIARSGVVAVVDGLTAGAALSGRADLEAPAGFVRSRA